MADYQKMYLTLFRAVTDAIATLQRAQQQAEELYITADETDVIISEAHHGGTVGENST